MKTEKKQTEKTNSSVPVIVLAIVIILALAGSVFLGIKGLGFGGKVKSQVSQDEIDQARAKMRANAEGEKDIYVTAFKEDVTWTPGSDPATLRIRRRKMAQRQMRQPESIFSRTVIRSI